MAGIGASWSSKWSGISRLDNPDANRATVWAGAANANGVHQTVDSKNGVLPVYQPFYGDFPDADSNWSNGGGDARASVYYPGPTATRAIPLICDQGLKALPPAPCNPAPTFPLTVQADAGHPDVKIQTGQTIGGNGSPVTI